MPTTRGYLSVSAVGDDLYAVGGFYRGTLTTVEKFDAGANTWTTVTAMASPRYSLAVVTAADGSLYAIGGAASSSLTTVERAVIGTAVTPTPTPAPAPSGSGGPPVVGGIMGLVESPAVHASDSEGSGGAMALYAALAGVAATAIGASAWVRLRRRSR